MRSKPSWVWAFSFSYFFDYGFTAVMLLTNRMWVDLAHFIFIPFIGVYGYLVYRFVLYFLVLWAFRLAAEFSDGMLVLKGLTVFYTIICFYNIAGYYLFFRLLS